jgi:hypothetical protein
MERKFTSNIFNCDVIRTVVPTAQAVNTASFHYTNPTNKVPTAEIINCSSWNMDTCFRAEEAGIMIKPTTLNTAKSFSYSRKGQDILLVFGRADLGANMYSASIPYAGLTGIIENAGIVIPKDGVITTLTARSNGAITAGSLTVKGYKNDVNLFGQNILSSSAQQGIVNIDNYIFNAGDKISVYAYSTADFTPYGTLDIVVSVLVKLLYC